MKYLSVCSGIEAASVAWEPLGWTPVGFSEIEKFPSAVLAHHFPDVKNHGDFTRIQADDIGPIHLLVGGTPCQSFSIAGLRGGLDDDRGNLAIEFLRLAQRTRPRWLVWENVPGVLSSNGGRDFGAIVAGMVECGYGVAYRVLDAQYVRVDGMERAVPQRRRRVFVVGYLGDWRRAAAVLFEPEGLRGNTPPRREARQETAGGFTHCADVTRCVTTGEGSRLDGESCNFVSYRTSPNCGVWETGDRTDALTTGTDPSAHVVCFEPTHDVAGTMQSRQTSGGFSNSIDHASGDFMAIEKMSKAVRRLTPVECERLQGFPDNWTRIPYRGNPADRCPDGPRYKAIGNSMAVNCMRWIGQRIQSIDNMQSLV